MKTLLAYLCLLVLLAPVSALAASKLEPAAGGSMNTYSAPVATDTAIKAAPGYVTSMSCSPGDNAAVAGTIQLRDALAAGAGTIAVEWTVLAIDYTVNVPKVFPVNSWFATGIYLDFTTTSDVKCWVSYR